MNKAAPGLLRNEVGLRYSDHGIVASIKGRTPSIGINVQVVSMYWKRKEELPNQKKTFKSWQGTNKNAIRSARFVLLSSKATLMEKHAAARVIVAAQQGLLVTGVISTPHVLGTPDTPKLAGNWDYTYVGREASTIEQKLIP